MDWAFEVVNNLGEYSFLVAMLLSFTAGLITSFNPCMLGMASSVVAFQTEKRPPFAIVLTFILSFAITLTFLGITSSFFGEKILALSESYANLFHKILAMTFVLIGLYIIGLKLHHFLKLLPFTVITFYSKKVKQKNNSSPIFKAYSLGTLFGVTPSPCTTPMILAMLAYTSLTGSVMLGGLLLFSYGIGHGIPFLIIGMMTVKIKRTVWMARWNRFFNKGLGLILVLIGIFFFLFENNPMDM